MSELRTPVEALQRHIDHTKIASLRVHDIFIAALELAKAELMLREHMVEFVCEDCAIKDELIDAVDNALNKVVELVK